MDLTAAGATANGTITAWADGTTRPGGFASLSYLKGITAATAGIVGVGAGGAIDLYNYGTSPVTVAVDLTGSYYAHWANDGNDSSAHPDPGGASIGSRGRHGRPSALHNGHAGVVS